MKKVSWLYRVSLSMLILVAVTAAVMTFARGTRSPDRRIGPAGPVASEPVVKRPQGIKVQVPEVRLEDLAACLEAFGYQNTLVVRTGQKVVFLELEDTVPKYRMIHLYESIKRPENVRVDANLDDGVITWYQGGENGDMQYVALFNAAAREALARCQQRH